MQMENLCRCCLLEGDLKDLNSPYKWFDKEEIYSNMLNDCFRINLHNSKSSKICDVCIKDLRNAFRFKEQVLKADEEFHKRINQASEEKPLKIKLEAQNESHDESDDYVAPVAEEYAPVVTIKKEAAACKIVKVEQKITKNNMKPMTGGTKKRGDEKIKSMVTRLAGIRGLEIKQKKNSTIVNEKIVNMMWATARIGNDKTKHKENIRTILNYSNAVPFKTRSLLGYICSYCDSAYPDPNNLRSHTEAEHAKDRLKLNLNFDTAEFTVNFDVTDLTCKLCNEEMENLTILKEHLVKVHGKNIHSDVKDYILQFKLEKGDVYNCSLCSSTYETFKMLKQHMNIHYSNYACNKCEATFALKRSLTAHIGIHQQGSFKCDFCEKVFATKTKKHYHAKTKHSGARNIGNCPYCDMSFRNYYQRNQHLVKEHNAEARYKCNVCNKAYLLKTLLMYHIKRNHLMEKNCQCTECGYRFFSKKSLKAHMVKHTGEKKFSCEICLKSYARKYTLREHMRIHNNDRRFKCDVCEMTFVQKCSLKSHLLSNHGISVAASDIISIE